MMASVMRMILMRVKLTADSSGVCAPAPCARQTFYRRIKRRVNVRALRARTLAACHFPLKIRENGRAGSLRRDVGQSACGAASSKQTSVL
jgi:hypothetical protein